VRRKLALAALALLTAVGMGFVVSPAQAVTPFKVLAFYNGTWDAAHIDFDKEAKEWFPQQGTQYGFTWEATTDWSRLNATDLAQYKVIMFLDDAPPTAQRAAFQQYMDNGGAFFGFHVSAFTTDPGSWNWYYNTLLGSGAFQTNTWGPTRITYKVEDPSHPSMAGLPATFQSAVSEWYSWSNDLRQNSAIDILASVDASSFPVGTDPNQSWYGGYYPILWSNRNYHMLYANFGHNDMNYSTNTRTSSTFESADQNRWIIQGLLWLAGETGTPSPSPTPSSTISPTAWYSVINKNSAKCVDARAAGTTNGTPIQQYTCNSTYAQQFRIQATSGGYVQIDNRGNSTEALDITDRSLADGAKIQLWAYGGSTNQQWLPVSEGNGYYHFVSRASGKCLDVPGASTSDSIQLQQYACNGTAAQSFRLSQMA
jgi:Trehalose utilisation/Ricin-type beta-trefoil lectin domain